MERLFSLRNLILIIKTKMFQAAAMKELTRRPERSFNPLMQTVKLFRVPTSELINLEVNLKNLNVFTAR